MNEFEALGWIILIDLFLAFGLGYLVGRNSVQTRLSDSDNKRLK